MQTVAGGTALLGRASSRAYPTPPAPKTQPHAFQASAAKPLVTAKGSGARELKVFALPDEGDGDEGVDIDALAKRLSQEAASRAWLDEAAEIVGDVPAEDAAPQAAADSGLGPFGVQTLEAFMEVLEQVGQGGFSSDDFELVQRLGQLSVAQESSDGDSPLTRSSTDEPQPAILAYLGRYYSRFPYESPVSALIKEFLPMARSVGANELQIMAHLCGEIPEQKWKAATARPDVTIPVVPVLGYFLAQPSDEAASMSLDEEDEADLAARMASTASLWLVYKWERATPLSLYPSAEQARPEPSGFGPFWSRSEDEEDAIVLGARTAMLRSITAGTLYALNFCHQRSVVHGSLSSGCIMLSTATDQKADELVVKLDNFGFGTRYYGTQDDGDMADSPLASSTPLVIGDTPLEQGQRADLQAMGLILAETYFEALTDAPPGQPAAVDVRYLLLEVFDCNVSELRDYCLEDPNCARVVDFLDTQNGGGWSLLDGLLKGKSAGFLLESGFLTALR